jgi:muramoyltetrapeptide carboxypeptidase LdcA involved in peptidoglycan recycling
VPKDPQAPHFPVDRLVLDMVDSLGKPAIANLSYGHIPRKLTLPIGLPVTMDAGRGEIRLLESAVA